LLLTLEQCAIIGRKSEVKSGVLAVSRQPSAVSRQPSAVSRQPSVWKLMARWTIARN